MNRTNGVILFFYFALISSLLQSCLFVKTSTDWNGMFNNFKSVNDSASSFDADVSIGRKSHVIPLPLILIEYSNKEYKIDFRFTSQIDFGGIDSVQISICDSAGKSIISNRAKPKVVYTNTVKSIHHKLLYEKNMKNFFDARFKVNLGRPSFNKNSAFLLVDCTVYMKDSAENIVIYDCHRFKLKRDGRAIKVILSPV